MLNENQLCSLAITANRVQLLIDGIKQRYRYDWDNKNRLLDIIVKKYSEPHPEYLFFERGNPTGFFIRMLYGYRLSCKLSRMKVFYKVILA